MAISNAFVELELMSEGPINKKQVSEYFSVLGKLNRKKAIAYEKELLSNNPKMAEIFGDTGLNEIFVEGLFNFHKQDTYMRREDTDYLEIFFNTIHLIRQSHIFWRIVPVFWNTGGSYDERWLALFKKHQRKENFRYRNICFRSQAVASYSEGHRLHIHNKAVFDYQENYFNRYNINDYVKLYRAFQVRQGKPVRKEVRKVDNQYAHLQEEGKGIAFTASKIRASVFLNQQNNSFYYKTELGIESVERMKQIIAPTYGATMNLDMILRENVYSCVGTFAIKKKDLIASNFYNGEMEVLADPASARLLRYEFINFYDALATHYIIKLLTQQQDAHAKRDKRPYYFWPHILPEHKLIRIVSKLFREYLDDDGRRRFLKEKVSKKDQKFIMKVIQEKVYETIGSLPLM